MRTRFAEMRENENFFVRTSPHMFREHNARGATPGRADSVARKRRGANLETGFIASSAAEYARAFAAEFGAEARDRLVLYVGNMERLVSEAAMSTRNFFFPTRLQGLQGVPGVGNFFRGHF